MESPIFQHHMGENVCFGCGHHNPEGLQIESRWEGDLAICQWTPTQTYWGWPNIVNGGVIATLVDCHCMGTAMAAAYLAEERSLSSDPIYRYATGSLSLRYHKPTPADQPLILKASIMEQKGRKTTLTCEVWSGEQLTVTAEVVALRVVDSSQVVEGNPFSG